MKKILTILLIFFTLGLKAQTVDTVHIKLAKVDLSTYLLKTDTTNKWVNTIANNATLDSLIYYIGSTRYAIPIPKDTTSQQSPLYYNSSTKTQYLGYNSGSTVINGISNDPTAAGDSLKLITGYASKKYADSKNINKQNGLTIIPLHYGVLRGRGSLAAESYGTQIYTLASPDTLGQSTITLTANSSNNGYALIVGQLIVYQGTDSSYYTASIKSISGATITLNSPTQAPIAAGAYLFNFYNNDYHPNLYGFYAIADYSQKILTDYRVATRPLFTRTTGAATATLDTATVPYNPGSTNVVADSVYCPTAASDAFASDFNLYEAGAYVIRLYINTLGNAVNIRVILPQNMSITQTITTNDATEVDIPFVLSSASTNITVTVSPVSNGKSFIVNQEMLAMKTVGIPPKLNTRQTMVVYGDSWGQMTGIAQRIQALNPNLTIINKSVGGRTVSDLLANFTTDVVPNNPDIVWVVIGTNDYANLQYSDTLFSFYINQLKGLVAGIGAHLFLTTPSVAPGDVITAKLDRSRRFATNTRYYDELINSPTVTSPLTNTNGVLGISQSTGSQNGYLSSTDWNTFNNSIRNNTTTTPQTASININGSQSIAAGAPNLFIVGAPLSSAIVKITGYDNSNTYAGYYGAANGVVLGQSASTPILSGYNSTLSSKKNLELQEPSKGNVGIGIAPVDTVSLLLRAGTTTVAPFNIPAGILTTNLGNGNIENNSSHLYITLGGVRYQLDQQTVGYAPLASPALTGIPTAPTPASSDNSTQIATTAFVKSILPAYIQKSANYTLTSTDNTVEVTATGTTQTLPTAVGISGKSYTIVYTAATGTATIATTSSQTFLNITGTPITLTLSAPATGAITSYTFQSNGTAWVVTGKVKNE